MRKLIAIMILFVTSLFAAPSVVAGQVGTDMVCVYFAEPVEKSQVYVMERANCGPNARASFFVSPSGVAACLDDKCANVMYHVRVPPWLVDMLP